MTNSINKYLGLKKIPTHTTRIFCLKHLISRTSNLKSLYNRQEVIAFTYSYDDLEKSFAPKNVHSSRATLMFELNISHDKKSTLLIV